MDQHQGTYPTHWEADVVLRDGGAAHLRPITPHDRDALQAMHEAQSEQSIYFRFFAPLPSLSPRDLDRLTTVDHIDRVALVVTIGGAIIAVGRYDRVGADVAEVAFSVADAHQGRGLGSVLLEHLAAAARERHIYRFVADVLPQNAAMIGVFRDAGFEVHHVLDDGIVSMEFAINPTRRSLEVMSAREHRSESASVRAMLAPRSVAVIGVGTSHWNLGRQLVERIHDGQYTGALYAVGPSVQDLPSGVEVFRRTADLPADIDLAFLAVPASKAIQTLRECGERGMRAVVVVSAGFAEAHESGAALQQELVSVARAWGMRVLGPASCGLLNNDPAVQLNASAAPYTPHRGTLGLFAQSAGMAISALSAMARRGVGLSTFVSAGNRSDVSGNDVMQFWQDDANTTVVALYLESSGNPRKLTRIIHRLARRKPVIVVWPGPSGHGRPPGHQVRTSLLPRQAFSAIVEQSGAIPAASLHQLCGVAALLTCQPLPKGNRVALVGNAVSLMHSAQGHALTRGLDLVEPFTVMGFDADIQRLSATIEAAINQPEIDSVVLCFVPPLGAWDEDFLDVLVHQSRQSPATVVACVPGIRGVEFAKIGGHIPVYDDPADAVGVLASVTDYARWLGKDDDTFEPPHGINPEQAHAIVHQALPDQGESEVEDTVALSLLRHYGITWPQQAPCAGAASIHIRAIDDPLLGPVVSVAVVGDAEDLFHDVAYRAAPMSQQDAREVLSSLKASPALLRTAPGQPDATADTLADLISRVSWLLHHHDTIRTLHICRAWVVGDECGLTGPSLTIGHSMGRRDQVARAAP